MLYKIRINPYDKRKNEFKNSTRVINEIYKKMLKKKKVQEKITYSPQLVHLERIALNNLHAAVSSVVKKKFKTGISMHGEITFEIFF